MQYPQWWERLLAGLIDGIIMAVVVMIIATILVALGGTSITAIRILGFLAALINTALIVAYKVFFESGKWQATPGKMVFGLKVVDESGQRAPLPQVLMRTWPWWINLLGALGALLLIGWALNLLIAIAIIAIFCTFFMPPGGRCIHDTTAKMYVIKGGPGMIKTA
ncbi:MAG TPA: RDD family protein [Alphaproteobacteria bacterium]|jgi:uncharacterized RDD family membrane protein YckC